MNILNSIFERRGRKGCAEDAEKPNTKLETRVKSLGVSAEHLGQNRQETTDRAHILTFF
jgi:hypothetical protein